MLESLKFVQGAMSKKSLMPSLSHYRIHNSIITSYNGSLALSCPIDCDIDCVPEGESFFKAIEKCKGTVSMHMTDAGRLAVKSDNFRVYINCMADKDMVEIEPEGEFPNEFDGTTLMKALVTVQPFIGDDALRPWSTGVLLDGTSVFATNNAALLECFTATEFPFKCNLPSTTVKELLRIKKTPSAVQGDEESITFHYENGGWLKTQLLSPEWPDLKKILGGKSNLTKMDDRVFDALETLKPFLVDSLGKVILDENGVMTSEQDGIGANVDIEDFELRGAYNLDMLMLLKDIAETADFATYPKPVLFQGEFLRGAIMGLKQ